MSFVNKLSAKCFSKKVGQDEFGNEYRISCFKNYLGQNKRIVIYFGKDIPTKVPPIWHAWLHYMSDDIPDAQQSNKVMWQKQHIPNLTGTVYAYDPSKSISAPAYIRWNPNK